MNRAERRRLEKQGVKGADIPSLTVDDFIHFYTLSMMLALDSAELGKEKALEIMSKVQENADCMISGHIDQKDVETMCSEIYGIEFVEYIKKHAVFVKEDGTLIRV